MKNISLILNIVLIIAVGILYVLQFSGKKSQQSATISETKSGNTVQITDLPVGYVNMDSLLIKYSFFMESKELLAAKQKNMETNLASQSKSYEKKLASFQEKIDKQLVTRRQAEEMNQQLMEEQQKILQTKDEFSYQLMQQEQIMNRQVYDSILSFLKDYNKDNRFKMIIANNTGGTLLYGDKSLNLTDVVLEGINDRYKGKAKTKTETAKNDSLK